MPNMQWANHSGRARLTHQVYARDQADPYYLCPVCKQPIDWSLPWPHPMSRSADHTHELQDGGPIDDVTLMWSAHLHCNASKGATRRHQREREARQAGQQTIHIDPSTL
jgi:hypothetical protein